MEEKRIKILVIDDDEPIRTTYAEVFQEEGFDVSQAADGLAGLDKAIEIHPDVIFTGIIMPKMDGFALKDALSKNVATSEIPVVMFSHMGREEDRRKAQEIGIKEFIVRDLVSPREAANRIKDIVGVSPKEYALKFSSSEMDAPKLAKDLHIDNYFQCKECRSELVLRLKVFDNNKQEFIAKIVCPKCG